nr:phosphomevalonate kinase [Ornithinibacillus contaminans]
MSNSMLTIQVPGKLMIAGEFAVLEPHHNLAVMAVNRFIEVTIAKSERNLISLEKFQLTDLQWDFEENQVTIRSADNRVNFVQEAMTVACMYLEENAIPLTHFSMQVNSDLDDKGTGKKYGLGSSAAVVVGVITAILQHHLYDKPDPSLVFQLAAISHVKAQGNGSGADVAASTFGGILNYASFQAEWLRTQYKQANSIMELLHMDWPYYQVKPIALSEDVHLCIGWTGSPASTGNLVERILRLRTSKPTAYQAFLQSSEAAVMMFLNGLENNDFTAIKQGIKQNRAALVTVGKEAHTELETTVIKTLCDLAEEFGGAAKQSGAGGGDCGIAFMPSAESAKKLAEAWRQQGIIPLDLLPYPNGAKAI